MSNGRGRTWALILAAGDGARLRSLTTAPSGSTIPKQYCSLFGGPSLLQETVARAGAIAPSARTCVIVAEHHRGWCEASVATLPEQNVIRQPANCGTANGILLPLLHILARDAAARLVLLPSDHHVRSEATLAAALRKAVMLLDGLRDRALLLGLEPEDADPELGYILPESGDSREAMRVGRFVEKPSPVLAHALISRGALWNAFIVAARGSLLLQMFRRHAPAVTHAMQAAVAQDLRRGHGDDAVRALYGRLPTLDFSRDILSHETQRLRVLRVPACGWNDLGTPQRLLGVLKFAEPQGREAMHGGVAHLSLAAQHARLRA